ncbi:MAG TPA: response regulator [Microbacterium sp.]|uniref:response regulator n=1 Tax=Microbacterium sp. TaxID=51671 RepID=UPI002B4A492D|nr:response regulator [Microbacterium sp.]HKT56818.1 response regulator [Microbacterium sp.]
MTLTTVIVEDESAVARLHRRFLESDGTCAVVGMAATGPAAVGLIAETEPDLVLLDIYLPGMSGLDVLRAVRAARHRQPEFIAVTAARDFASVRDARLAGVRHYLVKPFAPADLAERVAEVARELAATGDRALDQSEIDTLIRTTAAVPTLPKGLSVETLAAVRTAVAAAPWSSAAAIGEVAGVSRVSARRYLEYLTATGIVRRRLDYATSGRPGARYGPADEPLP